MEGGREGDQRRCKTPERTLTRWERERERMKQKQGNGLECLPEKGVGGVGGGGGAAQELWAAEAEAEDGAGR